MAENVGEWDANYIEVTQEMLFELLLAANYMDIKSLLDLADQNTIDPAFFYRSENMKSSDNRII